MLTYNDASKIEKLGPTVTASKTNTRAFSSSVLSNFLFFGSLALVISKLHEIPWTTVWRAKELAKLLLIGESVAAVYFIQVFLKRWMVSTIALFGWLTYLVGPGPVLGCVAFLASSLLVGKVVLQLCKVRNEAFSFHSDFGAGLVIKSLVFFFLSWAGGFNWQTLCAPYLLLLGLEWKYLFGLGKSACSILVKKDPTAAHPFSLLLLASLAVILAVASLPEVGSDAQVFHLTLPGFIRANGFWHYDVIRLASSVMPLTGDLLFTENFLFAGEVGARLLSPLFILLTAHLLTFRIRTSSLKVPVAALYASYPILFLESSSLFIEVIFSYVILLSLLSFDEGLKNKESSNLQFAHAFLLAGLATSTKLPGVIFAATLFIVYLVKSRDLKRTITWGFYFCLVALPIYLLALAKTGNPVFPLFNNVFKSKYFETGLAFTNNSFKTSFDWDSFFQMTFQTGKFLEARNGSNGLVFPVLMLPLIASFIFNRAGRIKFLIIAVYFGFTWSQQSYLRYLLPFFTVMFLFFESFLDQLSASKYFRHTVLGVLFVLGFCSVYLFGASTWTCRDLYLSKSRTRVDYIREYAPERLMQKSLYAFAPRAGLLMVDNAYSADYFGPVHSYSWLSPAIRAAIASSKSPVEVEQAVAAFHLNYVMFRTPISENLPAPLIRMLQTCNVVLSAGIGRTCKLAITN